MSRITTPAREAVPEASKPILDAVEKQLGVVPNMFRVFALSPAALAGLTGLNGALGKALDVKTRERIALAVAQVNGCDYCLSAHTYLALNLAKITPEDAALARQGRSIDPRADAAVQFAQAVTQKRGQVSGRRIRRREGRRLQRSRGGGNRRHSGGECPDQLPQQGGPDRHRFPGRHRIKAAPCKPAHPCRPSQWIPRTRKCGRQRMCGTAATRRAWRWPIRRTVSGGIARNSCKAMTRS